MNVIGPIDYDDWYLLRMLRESVNHMKETNRDKYRMAIDVHTRTYKNTIKQYVNN